MATTLPQSPIATITFPSNSPIVQSAFAHIQAKNVPSTVNHCIRSALFSLIICAKHPGLQAAMSAKALDPAHLATAVLLHDLGWSTDPECASTDKRFEVDGGIAAQKFLTGHGDAGVDAKAIWYAIALHTCPSISLHSPDPLVVATSLGIIADFMGPTTPGGLITEDEFKEVLKAYPRVGFKQDTLDILCGLCKNKPETTFDNFTGDLGRKFVEGYEVKWEAARFENTIWKVLEANEVFET